MAELKNAQRVTYKATYNQISPTAAVRGTTDAAGGAGGLPLRAFDKAAFVQSLRIVADELPTLKKATSSNAAGRAAYAAVEGSAAQQHLPERRQRVAELEARVADLQRQLRDAVVRGAEHRAAFAGTGQALGVSLSAVHALWGVLLPRPPAGARRPGAGAGGRPAGPGPLPGMRTRFRRRAGRSRPPSWPVR